MTDEGGQRALEGRLAMAKLIYSAIASLDGYIEDEDGRFDWAEPDDEVHAFINDLERSIEATATCTSRGTSAPRRSSSWVTYTGVPRGGGFPNRRS